MAMGHAAKRRRVSPSGDVPSKPALPDFYTNAPSWDLEQDYESRPRKGKKSKESTRLPIKTAEGDLQHVDEPEVAAEESDNPFESSDEEGGDGTPAVAQTVETPESQLPPKAQIRQAKEELARISTLIIEDPEEHIESLKRLAEVVASASLATVKKLALGTQAAVYRDIIPGYRIRQLSDEDMSGKVSKDVRKLRDFEQSLLSSYRNYVQMLVLFSKPPKADKAQQDQGLRSVAVKCACSLLVAVPHFNFRSELLKIVVGQMGRRRVDEEFAKSRETLEEIFSKDDEGIVSLDAVSMLSKMMKARSYKIHPSVLDTFLHLRLLSEFGSKGSMNSVDKAESEDTPFKGKKPKEKREFRTKRERKLLKERNAVAKDLKEADALVSHEARDKMQAETLKLVFTTYFRILKLHPPSLVGAVLEGLAKYAHLINQDFFGDLLEVLRELITESSNPATGSDDEGGDDEDDLDADGIHSRSATRESILCSTTAFALLDGQDGSKAASSLHLDLGFFITHLYQTLYPLSINPDVEFHPSKSLRLPDPSTRDGESTNLPPTNKKVNFQTPTVLLLRCLQAILSARGASAAPPLRIAAFTKRLLTASLQLPEKSALAVLSLLTRVAKQHGRRIAPLWNTDERKGDGEFNPVATTVEGSNVFAGTVWEGELLRKHYCPAVADAAKDIEAVIAAIK
jgi:nucleolar complex protein 3